MEKYVFRAIFAPLVAFIAVTVPISASTVADDSGPGHFVEVENGKIYYDECGTGPDAVVLIHDGVALCHLGRRLALILQTVPHGAI